jgi:hypothetical protein
VTRAALPPFRVIEAALRLTTERLVREIAAPAERAPDWNEFEWAVARAACSIHGISALLASRLRWRGPAEFHAFLATQHERSLQRHRKIGGLLGQLHEVLGGAGIPFIPLKGSALRELGVYLPGERPQGDVDLLLHADHLPACRELLVNVGYRFQYASSRHDVYVPAAGAAQVEFGEHPDNPLYIELHTRVAEYLPVESVDISASICPVFESPGAGAYASRAALMRHTCLHTAGNMRANAMRFIQLHDIARLSRIMAVADWRELIGEGSTRNCSWWLFPPLVLAARYLPGSVPNEVLAALRLLCPRRLCERYEKVSIYEVSWSNLRIPALPGHEWARTLGDTLRFARSRLFPARAARDDLAAATAVAPHLTKARWYGVSHAERILRWMVSQPPRVQTLWVVSAAWRENSS